MLYWEPQSTSLGSDVCKYFKINELLSGYSLKSSVYPIYPYRVFAISLQFSNTWQAIGIWHSIRLWKKCSPPSVHFDVSGINSHPWSKRFILPCILCNFDWFLSLPTAFAHLLAISVVKLAHLCIAQHFYTKMAILWTICQYLPIGVVDLVLGVNLDCNFSCCK